MTTAIELKDPVASDPVPDLVENILGAAQYMSATYWFNEAAKMVCGTDPMSWIAAQFAGDWEAIQRAGIAISTLGDFNEDYSSLIYRDIIGLSSYWTGGATDEASKYFTEYSDSISSQAHDLARIGDQVQQIAVGMYETANAVKGLWQALFDRLITIAVTAAAAMFTGWTGVGGAIGGAAVVAQVVSASAVWRQAVDTTGKAWDGAQGSIGLITGHMAGLENVAVHQLPTQSYDHPGA